MSAATNATGEYLSLHRAIEADCEMLGEIDVPREVLWDDVQCAQQSLLSVREEMEKARLRLKRATDAWIRSVAAADLSGSITLSQQEPCVAV